MPKLMSQDEFRNAAKTGQRPDGTVFRLATGEPDVKEETRTAHFVFSDGTVDLAGDSIDAKGWDTDDFERNPVALFSHMSWDPPIGRASNVGVQKGKLVGDIEFASADVYPFADTIYRLVKGGFLKAVSVGFLPIEWTFVNEKDRPFGIDFKRQKLLEISVCCVPCNPNALGEARSAGIDTRPLIGWVERVADSAGSMIIPKAELEALRLAAKEPARRTAKSEDWKCGASRDLAIDDSDSWDGGEAEKSIFDYAGGDEFDPAKAAKGFLAHDASAPKLRGSYKLPFAHAVNGELKAVKGGIRAAASRLPQTDIPDSVKESAKAVLDHYEEKMKKSAPAPEVKSGRRISSANKAKLQQALDHHELAAKCIKDVMDCDEPDDGDVTSGDPTQPNDDLDPVKARLREARALKDSLNR